MYQAPTVDLSTLPHSLFERSPIWISGKANESERWKSGRRLYMNMAYAKTGSAQVELQGTK